MSTNSGGRYTRPSSAELIRKIEQTRDQELKRLDGDINDLLQRLLARFNDRDVEAIQRKLGEIERVLGDEAELDRILLGGSVAKHTDVDGISDVDALVILRRTDLAGKSAQEMLNIFYDAISQALPRGDVISVNKGRLAVTIKYRDGTEIQLLPALRSRQTISIAAADGQGWNDTRPRAFQRELTAANTRLNQGLVPTIKLVKSIVSDFPRQKQITGYHIEALALEGTTGYRGPSTPKALLIHVLNYAAQRVLRPMTDRTGQSRTIDADLGAANSTERRNISQALNGIKRRLETAMSLSQWRAVFGE